MSRRWLASLTRNPRQRIQDMMRSFAEEGSIPGAAQTGASRYSV
ncbi:MAG: hypothetical protein OJF47_000346 [Nitrospira sp.]|nr:MAG: hypothetical protein OJF47_000346 [Nitrospira sp.]